MKRVYAVAESVPDTTPYLTARKRYEVAGHGTYGFRLTGDDGGRCACLWSDCAHLEGGNWTRVEIDKSEIAAELAAALRGLLDEVGHPTADILDSEAAGNAYAALAKWEASK